jgi:hypothetical protein
MRQDDGGGEAVRERHVRLLTPHRGVASGAGEVPSSRSPSLSAWLFSWSPVEAEAAAGIEVGLVSPRNRFRRPPLGLIAFQLPSGVGEDCAEWPSLAACPRGQANPPKSSPAARLLRRAACVQNRDYRGAARGAGMTRLALTKGRQLSGLNMPLNIRMTLAGAPRCPPMFEATEIGARPACADLCRFASQGAGPPRRLHRAANRHHPGRAAENHRRIHDAARLNHEERPGSALTRPINASSQKGGSARACGARAARRGGSSGS